MTKSSFPTDRRPLVAAIALALSGSAGAARITVDGAKCTLVDAITAANTDQTTGRCRRAGAGTADTLNLTGALYTVTGNGDLIRQNGLPIVTSVITVNGDPDGDGKGVVIRARQKDRYEYFRFFEVAAEGRLSLDHITLTKGRVTGTGGAIYNSGVLSLSNSTLSGNYAYYGAGGLRNGPNASATLTNSTVSGNGANEGGGGMENFGGTVTLTDSTISGNRTHTGGGGVSNFASDGYRASVTLTNSTISGNRAGDGGGFANERGTATITHSTIASNLATSLAGGISNYEGTITLTNSLLAKNIADGVESDCVTVNGLTQHRGVNLIRDGSCEVLKHGGLSDDPKLGPLLDNGGNTFTQGLPRRSPAVDKTAGALCTKSDQRGVSRPQSTLCDIGAFERVLVPTPDVKDLLGFFDKAARDGALVGVGASVAARSSRLEAARNQLLAAGDLSNQGMKAQACLQLSRTLTRIDTGMSTVPDEYVTGSAASGLAQKITDLRADLGCK
jgi:hypothetical protein